MINYAQQYWDMGTARNLLTLEADDAQVGLNVTSPVAAFDVEALAMVGNEGLARFTTTDASNNDNISIANASAVNGEFAGLISGFSSDTDEPALTLRAYTWDDTGTEPVFVFTARDANAVTNRPLFSWRNNDVTQMHMIADGNLGIGITTPTEILHINGRGRSTSDTWTTVSDQRVKENINQLEGAREILNSLNPVTYNWISEYSASHLSAPVNNWGFISQEVEQVMPDMVTTVAEENVGDSLNEMLLTDLKLLNLSPLFPILVKGYQELDNVVTTQNAAIQAMQQQIDSLLTIVAACCQSIEPSFRFGDTDEQGLNMSGAKYILFQNDPNPFQYSTQIKYQIPKEVKVVEIMIVDVNGRVVKRIPLSAKETDGALTIYSSELVSGIYSYSLIADGRVLETKKMVCSK